MAAVTGPPPPVRPGRRAPSPLAPVGPDTLAGPGRRVRAPRGWRRLGIGVAPADISRIEGGRANPTLATLAAVAHASVFRGGPFGVRYQYEYQYGTAPRLETRSSASGPAAGTQVEPA